MIPISFPNPIPIPKPDELLVAETWPRISQTVPRHLQPPLFQF
jgi:hypothetical protein